MTDILSTALQGTQNPSRPAESRPADALQRNATVGEGKEVQAENTAEGAPDAEAVRAAVAETDPKVVLGGRKVEFSYDQELDQVIVTVKDSEGETIRQVPPEEFLKMAARFREMFGVLFDKTA